MGWWALTWHLHSHTHSSSRDEIFLQLVKQTTGCPDPLMEYRGRHSYISAVTSGYRHISTYLHICISAYRMPVQRVPPCPLRVRVSLPCCHSKSDRVLSSLPGWLLLYLACRSFPPSGDLKPFLLSHAATKVTRANPGVEMGVGYVVDF